MICLRTVANFNRPGFMLVLCNFKTYSSVQILQTKFTKHVLYDFFLVMKFLIISLHDSVMYLTLVGHIYKGWSQLTDHKNK